MNVYLITNILIGKFSYSYFCILCFLISFSVFQVEGTASLSVFVFFCYDPGVEWLGFMVVELHLKMCVEAPAPQQDGECGETCGWLGSAPIRP